MPLKSCQVNGKTGYKYGDSGKCYLQRTKALEQMQAIKASQAKRKKK